MICMCRVRSAAECFLELPPEQGRSFLSDQGEPYPVAVNRQYFLVCGAGRSPGSCAERLVNFRARLILMNRHLGEACKTSDRFRSDQTPASDEEVERVHALHIGGIFYCRKYFRYYPGFDLASHEQRVVGDAG